GYPTLKEVYGSPFYGVKTGFNEAFVIDGQTRDRLIAEDPRSAELLKPFLEGKDLKTWHAQSRDIWIIFTRRGVDIGQYPAVQNYLEQFRKQLEPKPKSWPKGDKWPGRKAGPYQWYEIQDTVAYFAEFEKTKIQYGHFSPAPLFHCNTNSAYSNDKSYIVPTDDSFVLGLLNSKTYWFLMKALCPFVRGGYHELRAQYMETLPIPPATAEQQTRIGNLAEKCQELSEQRYSIENNFRRRLPDLCPPECEAKLNNKLKSWWLLDFADLQKQIKSQFKSIIPLSERNDWQDYLEGEKAKVITLNQQIAQHEADLNQEVYRLFDLTQQ
nr:hypothetical protein [Spirochaetales bacterium]